MEDKDNLSRCGAAAAGGRTGSREEEERREHSTSLIIRGNANHNNLAQDLTPAGMTAVKKEKGNKYWRAL